MEDGTTLFKATRKGKSGWSFEFHHSLSPIDRIRYLVEHYAPKSNVVISIRENKDFRQENTYAGIEDAGRSYMVGTEVSVENYRKTHTSYILSGHWMEAAVEWAFNNPTEVLKVKLISAKSFTYNIQARGPDAVEIGLPYHGEGGEKHWLVHTLHRRRKLLINVD